MISHDERQADLQAEQDATLRARGAELEAELAEAASERARLAARLAQLEAV